MNIREARYAPDRCYRPTPNGTQRDVYINNVLPNVRWLDEHGIIHQACSTSNLTLCENDKQWPDLLHWVIVQATERPITCVACMGNPLWPDFPVL